MRNAHSWPNIPSAEDYWVRKDADMRRTRRLANAIILIAFLFSMTLAALVLVAAVLAIWKWLL